MIPFPYLCTRLLSSAFVRFWLFALPSYLFHDFHLFNITPSVEITQGVFLSPETFHRKIFPKIFSKHPKRLFADFLARICDEGKGCLCPAIWGGTPFLWACGLAPALLRFFTFSLLSLVPWSLLGCGPEGNSTGSTGSTPGALRQDLNPSGRLDYWEHSGRT